MGKKYYRSSSSSSKKEGWRKYYRLKRNIRSGVYDMKAKYPTEFRNIFGLAAKQQAALGAEYVAMNDAQKKMRSKFGKYYGEGEYWSRLTGMIPRGTFANVGGALGAATNIPYASQFGRLAGRAASRYLGFGDYTAAAPVTNQIIDGGSGVTVNASSDLTGDIHYSHREFIGNVTCSHTGAGASAFQQKKFELNPGLSSTFPFLSQLASNFELYDFQGLIFEYKPTSGENATANSLGKVMMATQYDPDAAEFMNSVQLQNSDYSASCKPSVPMVHGVETAQSQQTVNLMYVRTGNSTKEKSFTDLGYFVLATEGIPFSAAGTQILGELWVTYRIKLSRANLYNSLLGLSQPLDTFHGASTATSLIHNPVKRTSNAGIWDISSPANSYINFTAKPDIIAGCYQFVVYVHEAVGTAAMSWNTLSNGVNCTVITQIGNYQNPNTVQVIQSPKAASETSFMCSWFMEIHNTNNIAPSFRINFLGALLGTAGMLTTPFI